MKTGMEVIRSHPIQDPGPVLLEKYNRLVNLLRLQDGILDREWCQRHQNGPPWWEYPPILCYPLNMHSLNKFTQW